MWVCVGVWRGVHYVHRKVLFSMRHLYAKADPDINPSLTLPVLVVAGGFMDQEKGFRDLKLRSLGKGHFFFCFYMLLLPLPPFVCWFFVGLLDFNSFDHKK